MSNPKVVIVMARCCHSKQNYGIRFEQSSLHSWVADWAFSIKEETASREGYGNNSVTGDFNFSSAYPGCPFCKAVSIVKCSCGKVACWDGECRNSTCPWCGIRSSISGEIESLNAGNDV